MASTYTHPAHDEFLEMMQQFGDDKYMICESITQAEHAQQAAFHSLVCGAPLQVVVGLLYHDIGQLIPRLEKDGASDIDYLHRSHDEIGADWLRSKGFPDLVVDIARFHTMAKILLCRYIPDYEANLSQASKESLVVQREKYEEGNSADLDEFFCHPHAEVILAARMCDDMAKLPEMPDECPELEWYGVAVNLILDHEYKDQGFSPEWRDNVTKMYNRQAYSQNRNLDLLESNDQ